MNWTEGKGREWRKRRSRLSHRPSPPLSLPLHLRDPHQHFFILDRYPAREHLHRILKVGIEEDLARAVDEGGGGGVEDVKATVEGCWGGRKRGGVGEGRWYVRVPKEHEDVPDAELGGKGNGVVEEGEVPAGAVGGWGDVVFVLFASF